MGLIADLFKKKAVPAEKIDSSLQLMDMLREKRGAEIGKYLDLMVDPRKIPSPSEPSTLEDLDEREAEAPSVYTPPLEATVCQDATTPPQPAAGAIDAAAIETGVNNFFDEFARQASSYNTTVTKKELMLSIRRPWHSGESASEADGGTPVLHACLHTADWVILFFGYGCKLDLYLSPYDESRSLTLEELQKDGCKPLMEVTTRMTNTEREWYVQGKRLSSQHIPSLAKELLEDLVQAEMSSGDQTHSSCT